MQLKRLFYQINTLFLLNPHTCSTREHDVDSKKYSNATDIVGTPYRLKMILNTYPGTCKYILL